LFLLKQTIQKGNLQDFGQDFQHSAKQFKHKRKKTFLGGDSNVNARASMKFSTNLSTNYECETSP